MNDVVKVVVSNARGPASNIPGPPGNSPFTNLMDLGAEPDGSNSSPALADAVATDVPFIVLPAGVGTAKTYRFDADWTPDLAGRTIDADPAAVLSHVRDDIMNPQYATIQYARPTRHLFRSLGVEYLSLPDGNLPVGQKSIFLGDKGPDHSRYVPVLANTPALTSLSVDWNTGDTWISDEGVAGVNHTTSASGYTISIPGPNDGRFHVRYRKMLPGDRYSARPSFSGGSPLLLAIIRHTGGYIGISGETNGSPSINVVTKNNGSAGTLSALSFFSRTHGSYHPARSEWAIDVDGWRSCSVLFNGVQVAKFTTSGIIYDAGFGMFPAGGGVSVSWDDLVVGTDLPRSAGQLFAVAIFGDSRNAWRDAAPASYARNAMDLAFGVRCWKLDNFAVGGQASGQQLAAMQREDLSPYNHIHINIGTNDAQSGVSLDTFKSNIAAMANIARESGRTVSFGIFPLWYTQGQAGQRGQPSSNYDLAAPYRSAIRRLCADSGYKLIDLTRLTGPVLAQYVNASLQPALVGAGDPVVFDNIHFTALFNKILGTEMARLWLGTLFEKPTLYLGPQEVTYATGYGGGAQQPVYSINAGGFVSCRGLVAPTSGATSDGTVAFTLPPHARPDRTLNGVPARGSAGSGWLSIDQSGAVSLFGLSGSTFIDIGNLQFQLAGA